MPLIIAARTSMKNVFSYRPSISTAIIYKTQKLYNYNQIKIMKFISPLIKLYYVKNEENKKCKAKR